MSSFSKYLARNNFAVQSHQTEGVAWCVQVETKGVVMGGQRVASGMLADEMGLGKTNQMIGLILTNFKLHTLIVLPRALLEQWESNIVENLGHQPLVYHGTQRVTTESLLAAPVVLTTYGMLSKVGGILHDVAWDRVIFDEAHHLRNRKTRCHAAAVEVRATHKWLVTGTPIQNKLSDFYGLCAVMGIPRHFYINRKNMPHIVDNLVLKRTKADAGIVLPPIKRTIISVNWESDDEKQIAKSIHSSLAFSRITDHSASALHYFVMLQLARQSCIDMELINKSQSLSEHQSKINKVIETIIERKDNGAAKLVFCHYRAEIDKIKTLLTDAGMSVGSFDGRTTQSERHDIIGRSDLDVLVLQIKTGCEGLNLQHFSEVYFVSPHWNPAVEDQAVARSHRIGQGKPVNVFSFRMESFDNDRRSQTMDAYVKQVQRVKRDDMEIIDHPDPDDVGPELMCADGDSDKCAICLSEQHKHTTTRLDCGHCFHKTCINSWFERSTTCPTCRQ